VHAYQRGGEGFLLNYQNGEIGFDVGALGFFEKDSFWSIPVFLKFTSISNQIHIVA
jgi:hypothetical protein